MSQSDEKVPLVAYCDLVANPSKYDGQVVRVKANHIVGFEWSFLTDEKCASTSLDDKAHTWIIIPGDATLCENASPIRTALPPQNDRSESIQREVTVVGTFHNSRSGHLGGYPFYMEFDCLEKAGKWQIVD